MGHDTKHNCLLSVDIDRIVDVQEDEQEPVEKDSWPIISMKFITADYKT